MKELLTPDNVVNINCKFNRSDREKLKTELMAKSCANARAEAELMAKGFGAEPGPVFALSKRDFRAMSNAFLTQYMTSTALGASLASEKESFFVPSTIKLKNQVSVIFKLKVKE